MASADTTILSSSDVGEPKPGNPESAGFFANTLTFIYYIILRFSDFPKLSTTYNGSIFQAQQSSHAHDVMMPIV